MTASDRPANPGAGVHAALSRGVVIEAVESMTGADSIAPDHLGRGRRPATLYVPQPVDCSPQLQRQFEQLLYRQAALLDAKDWQGFIDLFASDGIYWMPARPEQTDWTAEPSIFAEDKLLMEIRMGRLQHPNAWSQAAHWQTSHLVGNVVVEHAGDDRVEVWSRFQVMELRRDAVRHFAGASRHVFVADGKQWRIRLQRVDLANAQAAFDYVIQAWI